MIIGTAVKICATLSAIADSVTLNIYRPDGKIVGNTLSMIDEGDNVWSYVYQSSIENGSGQYKAIVNATSGEYISVAKVLFELEEQ